jgi:hypothetical protein
MLVITSEVKVSGLTGRDVSDFMMSCTDDQYRDWWPDTHLQLHVLGRATGGVGDVVVMDEFIGRRRLRLHGVVEALEPGRLIVWRFHKIVPLPARYLDAHVRTEFPLLRDYLRDRARPGT